MMCPMRTVTLVEAPTSAGGYAPGQEQGPDALLEVGLVERLEAAGVAVHRGGRVSRCRWRPDPDNPRAANARAVIDRAGQVAALVRSAPAEDTILVLGGDCTVGVGTVAGLRPRVRRLGVVYVDRHADLNVPDSTVDGDLAQMATLDCGSMNFGDERVFTNPFHWLRKAAGRMRELGVRPEIEVFDTGMIANGLRLIEEGLIDGPGAWQLCLGVRGGAPADLVTVAHMLSRLPLGAQLLLLGVARYQLPVNLISVGFGGHARTGLEDNIYFRRGELATSNGGPQLVRRLVGLAAACDRPPWPRRMRPGRCWASSGDVLTGSR